MKGKFSSTQKVFFCSSNTNNNKRYSIEVIKLLFRSEHGSDQKQGYRSAHAIGTLVLACFDT